MKITQANDGQKRFKPFSINITFDTKQEAIAFIHRMNVNSVNVKQGLNRPVTVEDCDLTFNYSWRKFIELMKKNGVDYEEIYIDK